MKQKISVIMPVYNGGKFIEEAISSILNQDFTDFVFIIIDDGSSDNSENIIKSFKDPRILFIKNKKNLGLSTSLNIAISNAKTKYIVRMDQDDVSLPERLKKQYDFMEKNPQIGIAGTSIEMFNANVSRIKNFPLKDADIKVYLLINSPFAHPTVIIRKEIIDKYYLKYDSNFDGAEDYDLWERMKDCTKMGNISEVLLRYRLHQNQLSRISANKQIIINKIRERQFSKLGVSDQSILGAFMANNKLKIYKQSALAKILLGEIKRKIKLSIKKYYYKINENSTHG